MAVVKALILAGLITCAIFIVVVWVLPVLIFLIIFAVITLIAYAVIKEDRRDKTRPP